MLDSSPLLAFGVDRAMVLPLAVTLRSLINHHTGPLRIAVVTDSLGSVEQGRISTSVGKRPDVQITYLPPTRSVGAIARAAKGPESAFFRLMLPELFPNERHLLYLDADILVRASIGELWARVRASEAPLLAAVDHSPTVSTPYQPDKPILPVYAELGIPPDRPYFNSGVLGMNLEYWRTHDIAARIGKFTERYGQRCPFWDQAGFNAILGHQIEPLDPLWNRHYFTPEPASKIVHFVGNRKPFRVSRGPFRERLENAGWHVVQRDQPIYQEYFRTVDQTAYAGWRPRSPWISLLAVVPKSWRQALRERRLRANETRQAA